MQVRVFQARSNKLCAGGEECRIRDLQSHREGWKAVIETCRFAWGKNGFSLSSVACWILPIRSRIEESQPGH